MSKIIDYPTMATVKDAANQFSVSTAFVRKLCREGRIRYTAISSRKWLVNLDSLARFFEQGSPRLNRPKSPTASARLPPTTKGGAIMAYTYIHIVENYFVKPSRGGYVLGTLQTKKGGRRSLMNGITYGSLTEAMEAAVRNVIHDCVVSREVKNLQEILAKAQLLKEEISANVQILNAHFPPKILPKAAISPTELPVTPSGKEG